MDENIPPEFDEVAAAALIKQCNDVGTKIPRFYRESVVPVVSDASLSRESLNEFIESQALHLDVRDFHIGLLKRELQTAVDRYRELFDVITRAADGLSGVTLSQRKRAEIAEATRLYLNDILALGAYEPPKLAGLSEESDGEADTR